jgi:hypothetical protein
MLRQSFNHVSIISIISILEADPKLTSTEIVSGRSQALLELKDLANAKLESGDAEVGF